MKIKPKNGYPTHFWISNEKDVQIVLNNKMSN